MMKKICSVIIVAFLLAFPLTACQNSSNSSQTSNSADNTIKATEIFADKEKNNYSDGFNITKNYWFEHKNKKVNFTLFTNAELDENGKLVMDDSQEWRLIADVGDKQFSLISRKALQLGSVSIDAFTDENDKTVHVLATVKDSGSIKIYDFYYKDETESFISNEIYAKDNVKMEYSEK